MKENVESLFFLYGCFRGSRPADHKSAESSVVLFPVCICFKNQRADSDKDTEGIASYYIKYPHCTHSDSLCQVLGFRKESSELLSRIKQHSRIPLITKLADAQNLLDSEGNQILSETVFSSNLYEKLLCLKTGRKFCHESQKQLIIL